MLFNTFVLDSLKSAPMLIVYQCMNYSLRSALIGSASFLLAFVGFSLSVVSALLNVVLPSTSEEQLRVSTRAPVVTHHIETNSTEHPRTRRSHPRPISATRPAESSSTEHPTFSLLIEPAATETSNKQTYTQRHRSSPGPETDMNIGTNSPPSKRNSISSYTTTLVASSSSMSSESNTNGHGFRMCRKKDNKSSFPSPSRSPERVVVAETAQRPSNPPSPVETLRKLGGRPEVTKSKSFCIPESSRSQKGPSKPRPRTQPYEAPYFAPTPISQPLLVVSRVKPTRSKTMPPH